jgi:hypothetical protein
MVLVSRQEEWNEYKIHTNRHFLDVKTKDKLGNSENEKRWDAVI